MPADEPGQLVIEYTQVLGILEKNFAREASLRSTSGQACQPLGAVSLAAVGFEKTLPLRAWLPGPPPNTAPTSPATSRSRPPASAPHDRGCGGVRRPQQHDRRPGQIATTCTSEMIAVSTTRMAEVIGDDLDASHQDPGQKAPSRPSSMCLSPTLPAFVGSHITGYDNALQGIIKQFGRQGWPGSGAGAQAQRVHQHHRWLHVFVCGATCRRSAACWA